MTKMLLIRTTVELEPIVHAALVRWGREEGRPLSNLLRRVLNGIVAERDRDASATAAEMAIAADRKRDRRTKRVKAP
jgi:hypothetical protein